MLFQRLLGGSFAALAPCVQALHRRAGAQRLRGEVEVERGRGLLAALCCRATRLPPAGAGPITVEIDAQARGEGWTRRIGAHAMTSRLWDHDGLLHEQLGLAQFAFRLRVEAGALLWQVERVRVFGLALPARWFVAVHACEFECDGRYHFDVQAAMPLVGPLLCYRGWLEPD